MSEVFPESPPPATATPGQAEARPATMLQPVSFDDSGPCPVHGTSPLAIAAAPELAAAMAETRAVRDGYQALCGEFGPSAQSGWSARISLTSLNRHLRAAGLAELPRTAASGDREDITLRYRRQRDEAREQLAIAVTEARALRALAAEIIGDLEHVVIHGDSAYVDRGMIADFRERAGLEADGG